MEKSDLDYLREACQNSKKNNTKEASVQLELIYATIENILARAAFIKAGGNDVEFLAICKAKKAQENSWFEKCKQWLGL